MIDILLNNKEAIFHVIIGLVFLIIVYYTNHKVDTLRRNGIKTEGIVERYHEEIKSKEFSLRKTTTFYPIIRFTDINGRNRQIISNVGSYPKPSKALPFDVTVYYLEENGEIELTTDSKIADIIGMGCMIMGIIICIFTVSKFI